MTRRFTLLGSTMDLAAAYVALGDCLGLVFEEHDSGYLGGVYFLGHGRGYEKVTVQSNYEDDEGYLREEEHAEYPTLVYLTQALEAPPPPDLEMEGFKLLRVREQ